MRANAVRSAATSPRCTWPSGTGRTDEPEEEDDPRAGVRVLRAAGEPGARRPAAPPRLAPDRDGPGALRTRDPERTTPPRRRGRSICVELDSTRRRALACARRRLKRVKQLGKRTATDRPGRRRTRIRLQGP